MLTEKSLKHLKSKDEFLIANVSNYFEKHSGRDSSSYIQHTVQATGVSRKLPTINTLLSVLKKDIKTTFHPKLK